MMRWTLTCLLSFVCVVGANCGVWPPPPTPGSTPLIVRITENQDREAFDRMIEELLERNLKATVIVDAGFVLDHCQAIQTLASEGFDIMAYGRPEPGPDQDVTMPMLSREDQEVLIQETRTAIEDCVGEPVTGFRAYRFLQNEDTLDALRSLGLTYNTTFVAGVSYLHGHKDDVLPYWSDDYACWAVPMHTVESNGRTVVFCDMPLASLTAGEWESMLKSEYDRMRAMGLPLVVELHSWYSGVDEGRFSAFVRFLDYALEREASFMTVTEYVAWAQDHR